jgi:hypothetical protein
MTRRRAHINLYRGYDCLSRSREESRFMAKGYEAPVGVDIAALRNKKKAGAKDLMRPGEGTPWEDRGAQGTIKSFVQTCIRSITAPGMLLDHMRRPDTTREASQFAYACSAFWAISTAVHMVLWSIMYPPAWKLSLTPEYTSNYYIKTGILSVLTAPAAFILLVIFAHRLYFGLISSELKGAAPRMLLYNIFCYSMGPSVLALIPFAGPPLALLCIFIAWCAGGGKRLYVSWRGAIVASSLTLLLALVLAATAWFVLGFVLDNLLQLQAPITTETDKAKTGYGKSLK